MLTQYFTDILSHDTVLLDDLIFSPAFCLEKFANLELLYNMEYYTVDGGGDSTALSLFAGFESAGSLINIHMMQQKVDTSSNVQALTVSVLRVL